jgi:hypothetical protein
LNLTRKKDPRGSVRYFLNKKCLIIQELHPARVKEQEVHDRMHTDLKIPFAFDTHVWSDTRTGS